MYAPEYPEDHGCYDGCTCELHEHEDCGPGDDTPNGERWNCDQGDPPWVCPAGIEHFGYTKSDIVMLVAADTERDAV